MAKATRTAFRIPTQQEVEDFMNQAKPDWPAPFSQYYAQRFHAYYMSVGWVVGRKMMKDWRAAFWAQWQHVKFKEDKEMLEQCLKEPIHQMHLAQQREQADGMFADQYGTATVGSEKPVFYWLEFYHKLMESWRAGQVTNRQLQDHYYRLDKMGLFKFSSAQVDWIAMQSGNDGNFKRGLYVEVLFTVVGRKQLTLKQYYDKIHQQPAERQ